MKTVGGFRKKILKNYLARKAVSCVEGSSGSADSSLIKYDAQESVWPQCGRNVKGLKFYLKIYIQRNEMNMALVLFVAAD